MHRPAGLSSESEDDSDFDSYVPLDLDTAKDDFDKPSIADELRHRPRFPVQYEDRQADSHKSQGIHSLSLPDLGDKEEKTIDETATKLSSKSPLHDSTNWTFHRDGPTYNEKENYWKTGGAKTSAPRSPPSLSSSNYSPSSSRKSWRKFQMHQGIELPIEELRMAAVQGNLPVVKALLKQGINVDQILRGGWTPLMFASSSAKHELVRYLLEQGADPNMHKEMFTALMAACASSSQCEAELLRCVNHLIDFGAKVDTWERHRMTPLMFACKEGKEKIVARLIESKADVNKQDNKGWSALCWAATKGHGRVVRILLDSAADPFKTNLQGQRATDIAIASGFSQLAEVLERACLKEIDGIADRDTVFDEGTLVPKVTKFETVPAGQCGEMEIVLCGLDLPHLIPLFQAHKVTIECFLTLSESDLEKMGVDAVGTRKKLLQMIASIHKQEWKTTSLPNLTALPYLTLPDTVAMVANINKHLRFIHASVGHLRDQIQATPRILQLGQEKHTVATLSNSFSDSLRNLSHLGEEVKFFKAHLDQICDNAEFSPADTILLKRDDGRRWQRRVLTSLVIATSLATAMYFFRPKAFSWLFSLSSYPQRSVFLDVI